MPTRTLRVPHGCFHAPGRERLDPEGLQRAERLAFDHGEAYDSYLALQAGFQYFFGRDNEGVVAFTTWRNHAYVVGGLLTARELKGNLLRDLLEFARLNRLELSFMNVLAVDLPVFREEGFCVSKVGEEPVINLQSEAWRGPEYAWVRRQENFCLRAGVALEEVSLDADTLSDIKAELAEISREHLAETAYGRELSMMVGKVDLDQMFRKRLFVARREGRIEAFAIALPGYRGRLWAIETFRKRPTAVRGIIPFLVAQIARRMRDERVSYLSLCQVPALRVKQGTPSDSRFVVNGLQFWFDRLPWFYDVPRLYHFKSRFRPQYRECFIATYPRVRVAPLLAFFFKWGIIVPGFSRLPRQLLRRMGKWKHSEHLADPSREQYVILDRLPLRSNDVVPESEVLATS